MARALCLLCAALLLTTCGGNGGGGGDASVVGTWRYLSGPAFSSSVFSEESSGEPAYLVLEDDGFATLVFREDTSGSLLCHQGIWSTTGDSLILQFRNPYYVPTFVFLREGTASSLELTDAGGTSSFDRETSLPVAFQCLPLTVLSTVPGIVKPPAVSRTGLAWDGTSLWFTADDDSGTYPIDPATGVLGAPIDFGFTQFQYAHAYQGGDFWVHCACGHGQETQRRTTGGVLVDSVDTLADLGDEMNLDAIAYDGTSLWLQGWSFLDTVSRLVKVDSDAEPDVLLASSDFDVRLGGLAWDGTHLWAVTREQMVLRIDPATRTTIATYASPDPDVDWTAIATAPSVTQGGDALYLIGTDRTTNLGVLVEVVP